MRYLRSIVLAACRGVIHGRHRDAVGRAVAFQLVRNQLPGCAPLAALELACVLGTELPTPLPDGLVGDDDSTLREELLDIAEAQARPMVEPNTVSDDLRRKPVAADSCLQSFSSTESGGAGLKLTIPVRPVARTAKDPSIRAGAAAIWGGETPTRSSGIIPTAQFQGIGVV